MNRQTTEERSCPPPCGRRLPEGPALAALPDGSVHADPLLADALEGRYELGELLGEGGMCRVFRARQLSMDRDVAVKVLRLDTAAHPSSAQRMLREARTAGRLRHGNTVTVFDSGATPDGRPFLVLEYIEGRSLTDAIWEDGAFEPSRAVHVVSQICDSLTEAHDNGIVHRDLKPDNIVLTGQAGHIDYVKVLDFGVASVPQPADKLRITTPGFTVGTPAYMAPEQARGLDPAPAADLYSVGVLLYEMLAGVQPFAADSAVGVMLKHQREPVPSLFHGSGRTDLPRALDSFLERVMAKAPEDRPASARALKAELLELSRQAAERETEPSESSASQRKAPVSSAEAPVMTSRPESGSGARRQQLGIASLAAASLLFALFGFGARLLTKAPVAEPPRSLVTADGELLSPGSAERETAADDPECAEEDAEASATFCSPFDDAMAEDGHDDGEDEGRWPSVDSVSAASRWMRSGPPPRREWATRQGASLGASGGGRVMRQPQP